MLSYTCSVCHKHQDDGEGFILIYCHDCQNTGINRNEYRRIKKEKAGDKLVEAIEQVVKARNLFAFPELKGIPELKKAMEEYRDAQIGR